MRTDAANLCAMQDSECGKNGEGLKQLKSYLQLHLPKSAAVSTCTDGTSSGPVSMSCRTRISGTSSILVSSDPRGSVGEAVARLTGLLLFVVLVPTTVESREHDLSRILCRGVHTIDHGNNKTAPVLS